VDELPNYLVRSRFRLVANLHISRKRGIGLLAVRGGLLGPYTTSGALFCLKLSASGHVCDSSRKELTVQGRVRGSDLVDSVGGSANTRVDSAEEYRCVGHKSRGARRAVRAKCPDLWISVGD